jgi:hypothetical protein
VIHFPVPVGLFRPASVLKFDWVTTKMAMAASLAVNISRTMFVHFRSSLGSTH